MRVRRTSASWWSTTSSRSRCCRSRGRTTTCAWARWCSSRTTWTTSSSRAASCSSTWRRRLRATCSSPSSSSPGSSRDSSTSRSRTSLRSFLPTPFLPLFSPLPSLSLSFMHVLTLHTLWIYGGHLTLCIWQVSGASATRVLRSCSLSGFHFLYTRGDNKWIFYFLLKLRHTFVLWSQISFWK